MGISIQKQWEYRIIGVTENTMVELLNQSGEEGWEAVGLTRERSGSYNLTSPPRSAMPSPEPTGPLNLDMSNFSWTVLLKRKKSTVQEQIANLEAQRDKAADPKNPNKNYAEAARLHKEVIKLQG